VIGTALFFAITQSLVAIAIDWYWGEAISLSPTRFVLLGVGGFILGVAAWWSGEARYKTYLLDKKILNGLKRAR